MCFEPAFNRSRPKFEISVTALGSNPRESQGFQVALAVRVYSSYEVQLSRFCQYSLPNVSNETVLFCVVRYLHEGAKTRETQHICKVFVKLVDVLLKHDLHVLLVQKSQPRHCTTSVYSQRGSLNCSILQLLETNTR